MYFQQIQFNLRFILVIYIYNIQTEKLYILILLYDIKYIFKIDFDEHIYNINMKKNQEYINFYEKYNLYFEMNFRFACL